MGATSDCGINTSGRSTGLADCKLCATSAVILTLQAMVWAPQAV